MTKPNWDRRNWLPLKLSIPTPRHRPGADVDFAHIDIPAAGLLNWPDGRAAATELGGSTINLSGPGRLGGLERTPFINHPEVGIIGVNEIVERAVVRDGAIVVRRTMNLSCSFDHRVFAGQDAAEFVQALRGSLEHPVTTFVR